MGFIGWVHTIFAVTALIAGAFNLLRPKGTPSHRWGGRVFAVAMVGLCGSALAIYRFTGHFNTFHALAFASLSTLAVGLFPVIFKRPRRYWLDMHYFAIGAAYAGLLAAFANELLARVPGLQSIVGHGPLTPALIAHIFQAGAVLAQFITLLGFALLLWRHDAVMAKLGRRPPAPAASHGCAGLSDILLLFGAISLIGGTVAQFAPAAAPGVWQFLGTAGGIATLILAYRRRGAPGELRWLAAYYFLLVFGVVWLAMFGHFEPRDAMAFRATVPMFGLIALGIFLSGELAVAGLIASAAILAAYQFAGDWFALALAVSGDGALLFAGGRLRTRDRAPPLLAREATP
jgi:uncharacterized membrane protein